MNSVLVETVETILDSVRVEKAARGDNTEEQKTTRKNPNLCLRLLPCFKTEKRMTPGTVVPEKVEDDGQDSSTNQAQIMKTAANRAISNLGKSFRSASTMLNIQLHNRAESHALEDIHRLHLNRHSKTEVRFLLSRLVEGVSSWNFDIFEFERYTCASC
eukprot:snap_masked-scaffold_43-processed-gene-1.99-mRNA-1 protein AED:1.00 eAED:1.00 QI:0/0/0/0/1/1/2/0/158